MRFVWESITRLVILVLLGMLQGAVVRVCGVEMVGPEWGVFTVKVAILAFGLIGLRVLTDDYFLGRLVGFLPRRKKSLRRAAEDLLNHAHDQHLGYGLEPYLSALEDELK